MKIIADALEKQERLKLLNLEFWNDNISNDGLQLLVKALTRLKLSHLNLYMPSNELTFNAIHKDPFDNLPLSLKNLSVDFSSNVLESSFTPKLLQSLTRLSCLKSLGLSLESMHINAIHFGKAMKSLIQENNELQYLTLKMSNNSLR